MSNTRPDHYNANDGKPSCIDIIEMLCDDHQNDVFTDYNRYQAFKYLWRLGKKDDALQDLIKAKNFIQFAITKLKKERGLELDDTDVQD